jgi:hypothetical protein
MRVCRKSRAEADDFRNDCWREQRIGGSAIRPMAACGRCLCNGDMHRPPAIHVELGPSFTAGAGVGTLAFASLAIVLALPLLAWQQSGAAVAVACCAFVAFRAVALRRGTWAVAALTLAHDRVMILRRGDGRLIAGHVRGSTYVGALLTSIVWRADDSRWSRAVLVLPDMLPAEDFRRLRVLLRYARSEVAEGAPASHA